MMIKCSGQ